MKKIITIWLISLTIAVSAQSNPFSSITFGFNRIPFTYYRPIFGPGLGDVPFPFHVSVTVPKTERLNWRGGLNMSLGRIPLLHSNNFSFGIEAGAEFSILKPESKWIFNAAGLVFLSHLSDRFSLDRDQLVFNSIGVGPEILGGYKFNENWAIISAVNMQFGLFDWGPDYDHNAFNVYSFRSFSLEARYTF
jgi:hypothetical protein